MCGLTGVLSNWLSEQEIGTFRDLMVLSSFRGTLGSGITIVPETKKRDIEICRSLEASYNLAYSEEFEKALKPTRPTLLMGHARFPTRGGLKIEDTHPHVAGNIIGMHNGTMSIVNGAVLGKDDNDSKLLFECLNKEGLETTIKRAVGEYAIAWIDTTKATVNFYRNTKRPLWFAIQKGGGSTVWYASEPEFLFFTLERTYGVDTIEVSELAPFHHLAFPIRPQITYNEINPVTYANIVPATPTGPKIEAKVGCNTVTVPEAPPTSRVQYITHAGKTVSHEELMMALAKGCFMCGEGKTYDDYRKCSVVWFDRDEFLCKECHALDPTAVATKH